MTVSWLVGWLVLQKVAKGKQWCDVARNTTVLLKVARKTKVLLKVARNTIVFASLILF